MAVTKPRNRTLIFRLTQDEYLALQSASTETGARSLSEFARERLLGALDPQPVRVQITELRSSLDRITEMLERRM